MSSIAVTLVVSERFPAPAEKAWELVTEADLIEVSQSWGPIPGVVEIRGEEPGYPGAGTSRVLVNSDGSTVVERITRTDPLRLVEYTITDLTNSFRMITSGADAGFALDPIDSDTTHVVWRYTWHARNAWTWPLLWLVANVAFKRYMIGMLHAMSRGTPRRSR